LSAFGLALAQFEFVEARLQHRHRLGAVAVLRAVVLALHDDTGRHVGDADRRVGLVDVLAAGAGGAEGVGAQVGGVDLDLDRVVDFGIDVKAGEAGVAAARGVEGRLAHQAVHAGFGAQEAVGVIALDLDRGAADARHIAVGRSSSSIFQPLRSQYFRYWRSSIEAQSQASVPPAPAWMSMKQLFGSAGLEHAAEFEVGHRFPRPVEIGVDGRPWFPRRLRRAPVRTVRAHRRVPA
jgi:hypothetical protein